MIEYKFSESEYKKLINNIKNSIEENQDIINKANQIDLEHSNKKINIDKLLNIIDKYKDDKINNDGELKKYLIEYNGDIYITIQLCLIAILNKIKMTLDVNGFLLGLNNIIVKIINLELKKYGIENLITIHSLDAKEDLDKILCIDDVDIYNELKYYNWPNVELVKINSIDLYCDDDDLVELRNMICDYARNNRWELELYDDHNKEEVADIIKKYGEAVNVVLLSNDTKLQEDFKKKITDRNLYINRIPLDETKKIKIL